MGNEKKNKETKKKKELLISNSQFLIPNFTFLIHLKGIVQGVGFRPFIYRLSEEFALKGWINNGNEGVKICITTDETTAELFLKKILKTAPKNAIIEGYSIEKIETKFFDKFEIISTEKSGENNLLLTPDYGICENCRAEIHTPENRRFGYAFTTCTDCGPRFSISNLMPFDRETTTMAAFEMCQECQSEYENPSDSRFYSQTNSCAKCGIKLKLLPNKNLPQNEIIEEVVAYLKQGKIGAIKGVGGYLLICDATNEQTIQLLRQRKHRPTKPFALMYPTIEAVKKDVFLSEIEANELTNSASPIVLLRLKENESQKIKINEIAPKLSKIGIMLPYTPLFELILSKFDKPIVATSGNLSGSPIVFEDSKAEKEFAEIADFIVSNNREIVVPQDDSVIEFSEIYQQRIVLRRGRGFAPNFLDKNSSQNFSSESSILAMGASMKSTFTWQIHQNLFISQYLGDLESYDTQQNFEKVLQHFESVFNKKPSKIIADKHEGYFSTQLAKQWAENLNIPIEKVQHHEAHFRAVLAENPELNLSEKILGVVWDGTGLGDDGEVWGGEFFVQSTDNQEITRFHFSYFDFILGDKMPREPRISALALASKIGEATDILEKKFTKQEWIFYQKLLQNPKQKKTSSMGRIFDGVASLLGLADKISYEGEAALLLEEAAKRYFIEQNFDFSESYEIYFSENKISTQTIIQQIIADVLAQKTVEFIALKFHFTLINSIKKLANKLIIKQLAFSGGVFQNTLLVDLLMLNLGSDFKLFFHKNLSPNDESISFGQLMVGISHY